MNINVTNLGPFILVFSAFMALICFYLGQRKTKTPIFIAAIGFFAAFIPPVAIIYLLILFFKHDLPVEQSDG